MKVSKGGGGLRLLQIIAGLTLFVGIYGMMTGSPWGLAATLFGGLGWIGFRMIAWLLHG